MSESSVLVTKDARGVATVTIDRPKVRNAIDDNVIRLLTDAFRTLGADGGTRMVVLTGSGAAFSAGADLGWMRRMGAASDAENLAGAKTISTMLRTLNQLPKPTIARINGVAYAAAAGLIAACDIAVAVEEAVRGKHDLCAARVPLRGVVAGVRSYPHERTETGILFDAYNSSITYLATVAGHAKVGAGVLSGLWVHFDAETQPHEELV